jgi:hypothetical protein
LGGHLRGSAPPIASALVLLSDEEATPLGAMAAALLLGDEQVLLFM